MNNKVNYIKNYIIDATIHIIIFNIASRVIMTVVTYKIC